MLPLLASLISCTLNLTDPPQFPKNFPIPVPSAKLYSDAYIDSLSQRTCNDVCGYYNSSWPETASIKWSGDSTTCDVGTYSNAATQDALNRLNYVRWLGGITSSNLTTTSDKNAGCMKCAVILDANNIVSTSPGASNKCWTATGQSFCQVSLVALANSAANGVSQFYADTGSGSLGDRRWVLYPPLNTVGIGQRNRGCAVQVVSGDYNYQRVVPFVAVPGPGGFPLSILPSAWSFSANINLDNATVQIVRNDGLTVNCLVDTRYCHSGQYGLATIRIYSLDTSLIAAGYTYDITVSIPTETWEYTTTLYDCTSACPASVGPTPAPTATASPTIGYSPSATFSPSPDCGSVCESKVKQFISALKSDFVEILAKYE